MSEAQNRKWYSWVTPQTFIYIMGAIVATVVFWQRTQDSWDKVKRMEETVNRQWQLQREMNDKTLKELQGIKDWIEHRRGYEQALKDYEIKP